MGKLFLIDGHSIAYRAYFALPPTMRNKEGLHTNAIFGFAAILLNIIQNEAPDYIAVAFDLKEPTFRHKLYSEYKGHRPTPDPEFIEQIPYIKKVVQTLAIKYFEIPGFEADDLLGTLAKKAEQAGLETIIVTGDLDALQLVTEHIRVMTTQKGVSDTKIYDIEAVNTRYGLTPDQTIDLKALKGDASDNIPGVPGIGEKTAIKLLTQYNSLENIISQAEHIMPLGLKGKILDNIEIARLSYILARINTDVPLEVNFDQLKLNIPWDTLRTLFIEMQFSSLLAKLPGRTAQPVNEKIKGDYSIITSMDQLNSLKNRLQRATEIALDIETTSVNCVDTTIVGISFCDKEGSAVYIPYPANSLPVQPTGQIELFSFNTPQEPVETTTLSSSTIDQFLTTVLGSGDQLKIGQNIKFDINVLKTHGIHINGPFFDTMVADYLLDPIRSTHNLKFLAQYYFHLEMTPITDLIGSGKDQITMAQVPVEKAAPYCCADADMSFRLKKLLTNKLKEAGLLEYYQIFEAPLIDILSNMECLGIKLDSYYLADLSKDITKTLLEEEKNIYILAGEKFNLNSPQQIADVLFTKLGLPSAKKTKTGVSTDIEVLESLAPDYEIAARLIKYRQLTKLKNTYIDVLPKLTGRTTGRIHTTFNQAITATGRLSSTNPNLQNIPIKTELGSKIRAGFIPESHDMVLVSVDYSQMELRILATLSGDKLLCDAFFKGEDIHTATARVLYEVSNEEVTADMRRKAKTINFGIIYGMGPKGLSDALGISMQEASLFINNYFSKYPGIKEFIDNTIEQTINSGYIKTFFGRIRPVPELSESSGKGKNAGKRIAVNSIIQGTAADIVKLKMISVSKLLASLPYYAKMLLQVHDELVFEVDKKHIDHFILTIKPEMENIPGFLLPFPTSTACGENWQEAK